MPVNFDSLRVRMKLFDPARGARAGAAFAKHRGVLAIPRDELKVSENEKPECSRGAVITSTICISSSHKLHTRSRALIDAQHCGHGSAPRIFRRQI